MRPRQMLLPLQTGLEAATLSTPVSTSRQITGRLLMMLEPSDLRQIFYGTHQITMAGIAGQLYRGEALAAVMGAQLAKENKELHSKLSSQSFPYVLPGLVGGVLEHNRGISTIFNNDRQQRPTRPYELRDLCVEIEKLWPEVAGEFMRRFREPRRFSLTEPMYDSDRASLSMKRFNDPNSDGMNKRLFIARILSYFRIDCGLGVGKQ